MSEAGGVCEGGLMGVGWAGGIVVVTMTGTEGVTLRSSDVTGYGRDLE